MSIREDFFAAKAKGSLWDVAVSIKRGNPLPLDADSIFESYAALQTYAADVLAYPGQVVAVVNEDSTGIYYLDQNLAIKPVGVIPTGDSKSIEVTADGVISIAGIANADSLTLPRMKADKSGIEWVPVSAVVQGDGNDNTTYEFTALEDKVGFSIVTKFNGEQVGDAVEFAFDVYTKSEADGKFLAKADYTPYDDTALTNKVTTLESVVGDEASGLVKNLADEIARAKLAEGALSDRIDAIDFVDTDELANAIKDFATVSYVDGEIDKIEEVIGSLNHFKAEIVDSIDKVTELGVLYLIKDENAEGVDKYNEYIVVGEEPVLIGDTTTDLSNYYNKTEIDSQLTTKLDANGWETSGTGWAYIERVDEDDSGYTVASIDAHQLTIDAINTTGISIDGGNIDLGNNEISIGNNIILNENGLRVYNGAYNWSTTDYGNMTISVSDDNDNTEVLTLPRKTDTLAVIGDITAALETVVSTETFADFQEENNAKFDELADTYAEKATTLAGYGITDAYTAAQTDAAILAKIGEMTGGESAADVLALLNAYKASNDREVWGDDFVNNAIVDGKYTPTYTGNSRVDDLKAKVDNIEANAEVNIIETVKVNGVALTPDSNRAVDVTVPTSITGMDGYSALDARVTAAKAQADKGVTDAAAADAKAVANTEEIGKHATRIESLETAKSDYATRIKTLEDKETEHSAAYTSLKGIVDGHTTTIAGKADQSALDAVSAKAGANEQAIKTLNETTIPGINGEIAKKANANDIYTKSEVEGLITASEYDDTGIKALISAEAERADAAEKANAQAIANEAARADAAEQVNAKAIADEVTRAKAAEKANADEIARVNAVLAAAIENEDDTALNSIKELAIWVEEHESEVLPAIENNTKAIAAIYTPASGEGDDYVAASGVLVDEIARVEKKADDNALAITAINNSTTGILATAKAYTDEKIAAVPVADGNTIIVNDKKLSVAKVSTDILAQGEYELVLCGGTATGHIVENA